MPQSGAAASRFGKSPDDIVRSTCGENLHGFHKDCFWGCKIELSVYGVYGKPAFCTPVLRTSRRFSGRFYTLP